jgi:hypothetical protein
VGGRQGALRPFIADTCSICYWQKLQPKDSSWRELTQGACRPSWAWWVGGALCVTSSCLPPPWHCSSSRGH